MKGKVMTESISKGGPGSGRKPNSGGKITPTAANTYRVPSGAMVNPQGGGVATGPALQGPSANYPLQDPLATGTNRQPSVRVTSTAANARVRVTSARPAAKVPGHSVLDNVRVALQS